MNQNTIRKILHITVGIFLLCVGLLGLVLPILNGLLFLVCGLIVLSFESRYVEKKLFEMTQKNKFAHHWHLKLEKWLRRFFGR